MPFKYKINFLIRIAIPFSLFLKFIASIEFEPIENIEIIEDARDVTVSDEKEEKIPDQPVVVEWKDFIGLFVTTP